MVISNSSFFFSQSQSPPSSLSNLLSSSLFGRALELCKLSPQSLPFLSLESSNLDAVLHVDGYWFFFFFSALCLSVSLCPLSASTAMPGPQYTQSKHVCTCWLWGRWGLWRERRRSSYCFMLLSSHVDFVVHKHLIFPVFKCNKWAFPYANTLCKSMCACFQVSFFDGWWK